jgi:uncharacterized membrane protein
MAECGQMSVATIVFSGQQWLFPAAGVVLLALALLVWSYRRAHTHPGVRAACLFLKLLGLLALAACLLEPLWIGQRARPGANFFALLADNSQGMQIKDRGQTRTRGAQLQGLLREDKSAWQGKLEENFQLRRYLFDTRLQATRDYSELAFDGRASSIGTALRALSERFRGQPLAGVLLLTDGNATDIGSELPDLTGLPVVYPVVIGTDDPIKDISLQKVAITQTAFEDAPVSVQADVSVTGYQGSSITAHLVQVAAQADAARATNRAPSDQLHPRASNAAPSAVSSAPVAQEKIVAEQAQRSRRDSETLTFRFQMRPEKSGISFYQVRVAAKQEAQQPEASSEATLANNNRVVAVDRGQGPYRVLYVSGRPNWEYKFLNRAIQEDDQVQLVGLIRIANREPKFEFRGRAGEASNPLFRGFDKTSEETERYDQPVLMRLNTRDKLELSGGFPKTPEELYAYHAVILDDLEAGFFTRDQMVLLEKFVSERGGGFLMLGGQESFHRGKYDHTPIGDMLPVYLDRVVEDRVLTELRLSLTREGMLAPWARLRNNESDEKSRLEALTPFGVLNRVRDVKPGASVLATVADSTGKQHPALIVQRFGLGRTAALTIGDWWQSGLKHPDLQRDLAKSWRQTVRWLVADVPKRIDLQVEPQRGDPNQAVVLQVRVRDEKFQPLDNAAVTLTVQSVGQPSGVSTNLPGASAARAAVSGKASAIHITAEAALSEPGLSQATFVPREPGGYFAEAAVTNAAGAEVGRGAAGWTTDLAAEEFRSLRPNRALLEAIAKKTGGELVSVNKLDDFARGLLSRKAPIMESWTSPLWHRSLVFLFALACFIAEWGLRRWKGLA